MSLRHRLRRLERLRPRARARALVCVDEQGIVLDDGTAEVRSWVGRHHGALLMLVKPLGGVGPLEVLGLRGRAAGLAAGVADADPVG